MILYLVQHGEAVPEVEDPARPLSASGADIVRRMAEWAARTGVRADEIRHSGKARAERTATLLAAALRPPGGVHAMNGLGPRDSVRALPEKLYDGPPSLMLVGHLPHLSRLASLLVAGDPDVPVVGFRNAGVVRLSDDSGRWLVEWVVTPELVL